MVLRKILLASSRIRFFMKYGAFSNSDLPSEQILMKLNSSSIQAQLKLNYELRRQKRGLISRISTSRSSKGTETWSIDELAFRVS